MTQVAEIKSPHEQRLEDNIAGKEDIYRESHKRVFKLLERFDGQKPAIDVERALYFTQSHGRNRGSASGSPLGQGSDERCQEHHRHGAGRPAPPRPLRWS